jgi:hypothetical protein
VARGESVLKERDEALEKRLIRRIDERLMDETGLHGAHAFLIQTSHDNRVGE